MKLVGMVNISCFLRMNKNKHFTEYKHILEINFLLSFKVRVIKKNDCGLVIKNYCMYIIIII